MPATNPYEAPRADGVVAPFGDNYTTDLERRVAELERQVASSWFLRRNLLWRVIAVWGCFVVGYAMLAAIAAPVILLIEWLL